MKIGVKRVLVGILTVALGVAGIPVTGVQKISRAETKTYDNTKGIISNIEFLGVTGELGSTKKSLTGDTSYLSMPDAAFDETGAKFAAILNKQMEGYLTGVGTQAEVTDYVDGSGLNSCVTFTFNGKEVPITEEQFQSNGWLNRWLYQAIASYPNLCTLITFVSYTTVCCPDGSYALDSVSIYSPIKASDIKDVTNEYKQRLEQLTEIPLQDETMSDMEKLLYLYNEIAVYTDYHEDINNIPLYCYVPCATLIERDGVCQSYAAVFNQAALKLGIDSLVVNSDNHSWNAVKLDDKWYYADVTWADPIGGNIDAVEHRYFLVQEDDFSDSHTLAYEFDLIYGSILSAFGESYDDLTIRQKRQQLSYLNGYWYFCSDGQVYVWDGESVSAEPCISIAGEMITSCDVFGDTLYFVSNAGLYGIRGETEPVNYGSLTGSYIAIRGDSVCWEDGSVVISSFDVENAPTPTPIPTPTPTTAPTATPEPTLVPTIVPTEVPVILPTEEPEAEPTVEPTRKPTQNIQRPVITLKNIKKKSVRCKIKLIGNMAGYTIQYATNKKFKNKKVKKTTKRNVVIKKLKKKKTYYFRVSAYYYKDGKKVTGKWSLIKKVKIKK